MEAGKINFPNCTKPPKSQNEKKLKLLNIKTTLVSFTIKDFLSYIFSVSEEYKDYTFDYDDMAG